MSAPSTGLPTERTLRSRSSGSRMVINPSVSPYSSIKLHLNSRAKPSFTSARSAEPQHIKVSSIRCEMRARSGHAEQPLELQGNKGAMGDALLTR